MNENGEQIINNINNKILDMKTYYETINSKEQILTNEINEIVKIFIEPYQQFQYKIVQTLNKYFKKKYSYLSIINEDVLNSIKNIPTNLKLLDEKDHELLQRYKLFIDIFFVYINNILISIIKNFDNINNLDSLYKFIGLYLAILAEIYFSNQLNVDILSPILNNIKFYQIAGFINNSIAIMISVNLDECNYNKETFNEYITENNISNFIKALGSKKLIYNTILKKRQSMDEILDYNQQIIIQNLKNIQILLRLINKERKL